VNISNAIIDEANEDIIGAQECMRHGSIAALHVSVAGLITLRNICTKMNLLKLEVMLQIRLDDIAADKQPEIIFK